MEGKDVSRWVGCWMTAYAGSWEVESYSCRVCSGVRMAVCGVETQRV